MRSFEEIFAMAAGHHGGAEALEARLGERPYGGSPGDPAEVGDDRWLSVLSRFVFSAGFNWRVIENKWPGFEEAFEGFEPRRLAMMSDDDIDRLLKDTRIVRHAKKILSVRDNAIFLRDLADEHGKPAAAVLGGWPPTDFIGLLDLMKTRGQRLGGTTAQYALRYLNKDSFVLSNDVNAALIREGVIDRPGTGKGAMKKVQAAFNTWMEESGRGLTPISRTLAYSVGGGAGHRVSH